MGRRWNQGNVLGPRGIAEPGIAARAFVALVALTAFLATWLLAGPGLGVRAAEAQSAATKTEAKAKLQRGAQLLQQGEFAQALAQFKEAYELVPSPKIYFNFGIAYVGLARYSEALESFEKFTQEAKNASSGNLADARQQIDSLLGKVERVQVTSDRDGAEVSIDGRSYGLTPLAHPIYVDPGAHQLIVQDHDRPLVENFNAFAGKEGSLVMRFEAPADKAEHATEPPNLSLTPPHSADVTISTTPGEEQDVRLPEDRRKLRHRLRVASFIGAGVGVACGVTGFVLRGIATTKYNDINSSPGAGHTYNPSDGNYTTFDAAGVGLIVAGSALVGASVITYLLNRERPAPKEAVSVSVGFDGSRQFGLLLSGRY